LDEGLLCKGYKPKKGDTLEYELSWGYPDAFDNLDQLRRESPDFPFNFVGLRTWERGPIRGSVRLEIRFERPWDDDHEMQIFDVPPRVCYHNATSCPASIEPYEFCSQDKDWFGERVLEKNEALSDVSQESYLWESDSLEGQLMVKWQPGTNYHDTTRRKQPTRKHGSKSRRKLGRDPN